METWWGLLLKKPNGFYAGRSELVETGTLPHKKLHPVLLLVHPYKVNRLVTVMLRDLRIYFFPLHILCVSKHCGYATNTCDIAVDLHHSPDGQGGKSATEVFSEDHISQWVKQATPIRPTEPFHHLQDALLMLKPTSMDAWLKGLESFSWVGRGTWGTMGFIEPVWASPKRGDRDSTASSCLIQKEQKPVLENRRGAAAAADHLLPPWPPSQPEATSLYISHTSHSCIFLQIPIDLRTLGYSRHLCSFHSVSTGPVNFTTRENVFKSQELEPHTGGVSSAVTA